MRLALIGIGHQGKLHLKFLKAVNGLQPVLLVDILPERARAAGEETKIPFDTSYQNHLSEFDAAIVAVPTIEHSRIASDLIHSGKHVLIEKPVAATVEEAEALLQLANEKG